MTGMPSVLRGTIGAFPCRAAHLGLRPRRSAGELELTVSQPIVLGPIAWRFELLGPWPDTASNNVSASAVAAASRGGCRIGPQASAGGPRTAGAMVRESQSAPCGFSIAWAAGAAHA